MQVDAEGNLLRSFHIVYYLIIITTIYILLILIRSSNMCVLAVSLQSTSVIAVGDDDHESDTPLLWENCWTPILSAMAEGCADSRKPVRLAASNALCSAILDKHVKNVPIGLMVKILGDVYIAIVLRLAEYLVREMELNGSNGIRSKSNDDRIDGSGGNSGKTKMRRKKDEKQFPTGSSDAWSTDNDLRIPKDTVEEEDLSLTVMPILCTICKVFADQITRFSTYPSFDRLWLRLLHVFGYFLGAPYGFDHAVLLPSHRRILGNELHRTVAAAADHLSTLVNLLVNLGIFKERCGLWLVTKDSLQLMTHCPAPLLDDPSEVGADSSILIPESNAPM